MEQLSNDLQFDFKRNGSMVLCFDENDLPALKELYERGVKNRVPALPLSQETRPGKRAECQRYGGGCYLCAYRRGVCPFGLTIAMAGMHMKTAWNSR